MKRQRHTSFENETHFVPVNNCDFASQLVDKLLGNEKVVVLRPDTCFLTGAATESDYLEAARSLSLIVLSADDLTCAHAKTQKDCTDSRPDVRGLGIIDFSLTDASQNAEAASKGRITLTARAVPVWIRVGPWTAALPSRTWRRVHEGGQFASVGEERFGSADLGPVPEGCVPREAVALVPGLPRCRVEAVSGTFPLFRSVPPTTQAVKGSAGPTETTWVLQKPDSIHPTIRNTLMEACRQRLAEYQEPSSSLLARLSNERFTADKLWVVVSYPGGLPPRRESPREAVSATLSPHKKRRIERSQSNDALDGEGSDHDSARSPLFILPSSFLCAYFHVYAGWSRLDRHHRRAALAAVQRLQGFIEAVTVNNAFGTPCSIMVACDEPAKSTTQTATLTRASAM